MSKRYLTRHEYSAILAGLRLLQEHLDQGKPLDPVLDILTDEDGSHIDAGGIDTLCDDIGFEEVQWTVEGYEPDDED